MTGRRKNDRIIQELGAFSVIDIFISTRLMTSLIIQVDEFDPTIEDQRDDLLDAAAMCTYVEFCFAVTIHN